MFFFLVEINYGPLGAGGGDAELLKRVRAAAHRGLSELRDCVGFNQVIKNDKISETPDLNRFAFWSLN